MPLTLPLPPLPLKTPLPMPGGPTPQKVSACFLTGVLVALLWNRNWAGHGRASSTEGIPDCLLTVVFGSFFYIWAAAKICYPNSCRSRVSRF